MATRPPIGPHDHTCILCAHVWPCREITKPSCKVHVAARVNKDGPYCLLCHHITMAQRVAQARGLNLTVSATPRAG